MRGRKLEDDILILREYSNSPSELVKESSKIVLDLMRNMQRRNDTGIKENYYDLTTYDINTGNPQIQLEMDKIQQIGVYYYSFYQKR